MTVASEPSFRLLFNRHELAGAFGDIGNDLLLLIALNRSALCVALAVVGLPYGYVLGIAGMLFVGACAGAA